MADSKNYAYKASGIIKIVFTKKGKFVATVTNSNRLKDYPKTKYDIIEII
jgi:hypothetical protein